MVGLEVIETFYYPFLNSLDYRDPMPEDVNFKYPACRLPGAM